MEQKIVYRNSPTWNVEKNYYIKKDSVSDEAILFVLPCTGGARYGDYFHGSSYSSPCSWRTADFQFRKFRKDILFAACSSVAYHFDPTGGSLVFEHENDRVKSNNDFGMPASSKFSCYNGKNPCFDINILIEGLKEGLTRAFTEFKIKNIFAILTPLAYKVAFSTAVTELKLWDKVVLCDIKRMGATNFFIKLFLVFRVLKFKYTGIFSSSPVSFTTIHKPVTEKRFEYWNIPEYFEELPFPLYKIWIESEGKTDYFLILEEHKDLPISELLLLYQFPIFGSFQVVKTEHFEIAPWSKSTSPLIGCSVVESF